MDYFAIITDLTEMLNSLAKKRFLPQWDIYLMSLSTNHEFTESFPTVSSIALVAMFTYLLGVQLSWDGIIIGWMLFSNSC